MRKIRYIWHLVKNENATQIERYCPQCKQIVRFTDSLKRRRNGNGKNIHEFAIYKCEKDHTWNKKLASYKADQVNHTPSKPDTNETTPVNSSIHIGQLMEQGYHRVEIYLGQVTGKCRLDRLLADHFIDVTRTQIQKWIRDDIITVSNIKAKPGAAICSGQLISIDFNSLH